MKNSPGNGLKINKGKTLKCHVVAFAADVVVVAATTVFIDDDDTLAHFDY